MSRNPGSFGHTSTTSEVLEGLDLSGKRALVTGASGGLGLETARALAEKGAAVTLAVRDAAKGEKVAAEIRSSTGNAQVDVQQVELDVPASVRAFGARVVAEGRPIHMLINNAGVMASPLERTAEGWELQFATNHLGHFLLTASLLPLLKAAGNSRVVNLSSAGHRLGPVRLDDPHFQRGDYDKWEAYGQAKTANIWFSNELTRRATRHGIVSNAVHPGGIMTDLGRHLNEDDIKELMARQPKGGGGIRWKEVPAGAATSVWAATAPELEGRGGLYLEDCHVGVPKQSEDDADGYSPHAMDEVGAVRLWELSEELLGFQFDLS